MPKIVLTSEEVLGALGAIINVQAAEAEGVLKLKLGRNAARLRVEAKVIEEAVEDLRKEKQPTDNDGRALPVSPKVVDSFAAETKKIMAATVELDLDTITEEEIGPLKFKGSIEGLEPLFKQFKALK